VKRTGLAGVAAIFAIGVWLCAAPWASGQQPRGTEWTVATRNDVWLGAALALTGFAGFFTTLAGQVRELYSDARRHTGFGHGG
jgi:predicted MFS family arabinose efflux permease